MGDAGRFRPPGRRRTPRVRVGRFVRRLIRGAAEAVGLIGLGKSSGRPTEAGCYAAGEAAYRWLVDEQKAPEGEVTFVGESLGGAIATELAVRRPCRALILLFPFTSFPTWRRRRPPGCRPGGRFATAWTTCRRSIKSAAPCSSRTARPTR
jgi:pimeloyl-ACP methyl ester carboxylesterase